MGGPSSPGAGGAFPLLPVAGIVVLAGAVAYTSPSTSVWAGLAATVGSVVTLYLYYKKPATATGISPKEFRSFPLIYKEQMSPNTALYRFQLGDPNAPLNLPIGQHLSISAHLNGRDIMRSYTPVSGAEDKGHFELLIKTYAAGVCSKMFEGLKLGDSISVKGPRGAFKYTPNMCRAIGMLAGGTGLTPMWQVIQSVLSNPEDRTKVHFIYANVSVEDILLKDRIDQLIAQHPDRFNVYYVLNNPPEDGWTGGVGFVSKEMIEAHMPAPAKDVKILLCGPPPMVKAMTGHLETIGFDKAQTISKATDQVFKF